jgi:hypothetical protein
MNAPGSSRSHPRRAEQARRNTRTRPQHPRCVFLQRNLAPTRNAGDGASTYLALTFGTLLSSQGTEAAFATGSHRPLRAFPSFFLQPIRPFPARFPLAGFLLCAAPAARAVPTGETLADPSTPGPIERFPHPLFRKYARRSHDGSSFDSSRNGHPGPAATRGRRSTTRQLNQHYAVRGGASRVSVKIF